MNLKVTVKKENKQKLLSHEFRRRNRAEFDAKQQMTPAASTAQESTTDYATSSIIGSWIKMMVELSMCSNRIKRMKFTLLYTVSLLLSASHAVFV